MDADVETVSVVCVGRCPHCPPLPAIGSRRRPPDRTHLLDLVPRRSGRRWMVVVYVDGEISGGRILSRQVQFSARSLSGVMKQARRWAQDQVLQAEERLGLDRERDAIRARHMQIRAALRELPPVPRE